MKVARVVFATATTAVFGAALVQIKTAIGEEREPISEEIFGKAGAVVGVLTAGIWMCALGRR